MRLDSTLSIYAGGSGSGCKGPNCGRKAKWVVPPALKAGVKNGDLVKKKVPVAKLTSTQKWRVKSRVAKMASDLKNGKAMPLALVAKDGKEILDGHHRIDGYKKAFPKEKAIEVLVQKHGDYEEESQQPEYWDPNSAFRQALKKAQNDPKERKEQDDFVRKHMKGYEGL